MSQGTPFEPMDDAGSQSGRKSWHTPHVIEAAVDSTDKSPFFTDTNPGGPGGIGTLGPS